MQKQSIKVQIGGMEYSLKADAGSDYVQRIAAYVDEKFRRLSEKTSVTSQTKIAVLTALNIADELFRLKEKYDQLVKTVEEESRHLNQEIDQSVGPILKL